ncbi:hypothetical protein SAMN05421788_110280 [Filimonas lacunae]|uniref:Uncharacterized protein n=1 Tax=Filimonas lacunae TaxID=477680 RepID=A0A173MAK7_9BACT|nr:DUF6580 family putative transport protein [Filimonas lacunae]BAV04550.1 hypothetical protein FLA_0542 [Filimonas lacunae]SIT31783.1 hypothetical protein SAMN05421788_110280 [Filimonas lacunae]
MKNSKSVLIAFCLLMVVFILCRMFNHTSGFTPQFAMAIFGGAIFRNNKKWAFALPLIPLFLGDVLFQIMYLMGKSNFPGFYEGQLQNYLLFAALTTLGFLVSERGVVNKVVSIFCTSLAAPTVYFFLSNFLLWASNSGTRGFNRPKTWDGLILCFQDALPFYPNSLYSTVFFSAVLFGGYYLVQYTTTSNKLAAE